jgi:branched-subunit amino acid transport protein AzlD
MCDHLLVINGVKNIIDQLVEEVSRYVGRSLHAFDFVSIFNDHAFIQKCYGIGCLVITFLQVLLKFIRCTFLSLGKRSDPWTSLTFLHKLH